MRGITYSLRLKITEKLKKRVKYNSTAQRPTFLCYTQFRLWIFLQLYVDPYPMSFKTPEKHN